MTRHVVRGGLLYRVADPLWTQPLETSHSAATGGRWNPPNSFGVLYLNATLDVARGNVARLHVGLPYGPEDLDPDAAPVLIDVDVPAERYVDASTRAGLTSLGLPASYPDDGTGRVVSRADCQPIGLRLFTEGELGLVCRGAASLPTPGEELAWFDLAGRTRPRLIRRRTFEDWFYRT